MTDRDPIRFPPAADDQLVTSPVESPAPASSPVNAAFEGQLGAQAWPAGAPQITIINQNTQSVGGVAGQPKNMLLALVLSFLFGPLGMLYATIPGAAVMFIAGLMFGLPTGGAGFVLLWPAQLLWTFLSVRSHNAALPYRAR